MRLCKAQHKRKNWLFFGSDKGGHTAAVIATIIQSAKRHGLNIYEYLKAIIAQIADHPACQIQQLLPNNWQPAQ
ncbi:MAG: transposase domain-containing protein [Phycisphaerae bacterium]|nr:transposase domain-containing protein [Phycisphaerae bacterium]